MLIRILLCLLVIPSGSMGQIILKNGSFTNGFGKGTDGVNVLITMIGPSGTFPEQKSITVSSLSGVAYCPGQSLDIAYVITGEFSDGNFFSAQVSDASGSFISPMTIGAITSTSSGSFSAAIPLEIQHGSRYRIRVVSSDPMMIGADNGSDILIHAIPSATLNAGTLLCSGTSADLNITLTGDGPWSGVYSDGVSHMPFESSSSPMLLSVAPLATTTYTLISVTDANCPGTVSGSAAMILNTAPVINSVGVTLSPKSIGTEIPVTVSFSDTENNVVKGFLNWGDGITTEGTFIDDVLTARHTYASPGVFTLGISLQDACGEITNSSYQYVVVYDPYAGFATGGGWLDSPPGAYVYDPAVSGQLSFGFFSNYKKGSTLPQGNTDFQLRAANLHFKSTSYEWLVIADYKAMYKGSGMLNGNPGYGFLLSAVDGAKKSSASPDKMRIKIWEPSGEVIYDNQMGAEDDAEAITMISGGSIVIHDEKSSSANSIESSNIEFAKEQSSTSVYPNPFKDVITVRFHSRDSGDLRIQLLDMVGQPVYDHNHSFKPDGIYPISLQKQDIKPAFYLLKITQDGTSEVIKLMSK
jgi:hypothetical protein